MNASLVGILRQTGEVATREGQIEHEFMRGVVQAQESERPVISAARPAATEGATTAESFGAKLAAQFRELLGQQKMA